MQKVRIAGVLAKTTHLVASITAYAICVIYKYPHFFDLLNSGEPFPAGINSVAPQPEGSSPHTQQPATGCYPEPGESTPHPTTNLPKVHLILSSHIRLGLSSGLFPLGFPIKTRYMFLPSPMRATCPVHLILLDLERSVEVEHDRFVWQKECWNSYYLFLSV
jgi:hypothetical protein